MRRVKGQERPPVDATRRARAFPGRGVPSARQVTASVVALLCASAGGSSLAEAGRGDPYLIVTRRVFVDATRELADYRRGSGYKVVTCVWEDVASEPDARPRAAEIKAWIDKTAKSCGAKPAAILLCGDETESLDAKPPWRMPAFRKRLYRWRSNQRKTFTCDSAYGDMDGDGLPDVPVGRLPVRTGTALREYLGKLRRYEAGQDMPASLRTVVWMGIPGYDPGSDAMMTPIAMRTVRRYLPGVLTCWWLSGDPRWPCWLPVEEQPKRFLAELANGSAFNLFGGHGSAVRALANVSKSAKATMTIKDLRYLPRDRPVAPLVFLACTIGRIEYGKGPCLAEAMWSHPGGPIVVVAATTQSHPLTNYYSAVALAKTVTDGVTTFGQWWSRAQRVGFREHTPVIEAMMKDSEGKLEENINLVKIRGDQPLMYVLLGDPVCRLRLPRPLRVQASCSGKRLVVRAELPDGVRRVSLDVLLTRPRSRPMTRATSSRDMSESQRTARRDRLERFNLRSVPVCTVRASSGPLTMMRDLPSGLTHDRCRGVRLAAFGNDDRTWAGVADLAGQQEGSAK